MDKERKSNITVTLTTDWKQHDFYIGMIKGRLTSSCPNIRIIDLSHDIPSFNIHHAAFVVRHSFSFFPSGTIHLILVNSESNLISRLLVVEYNSHIFVLPDNGIIGLLFSSTPERAYEVKFNSQGSFASLDCFSNIVKKLSSGNPIETIGEAVTDFNIKISLRATIDESIINGSIIYIDSYNNAITNISKSLFERVGKGRDYNIFIQSNYNKISKLSTTYNEVEPGELLGLFNSANLLEIAIRNGYAAELLSLNVGGSIRVNFL
jgi:hypothetical protein